MNNVYVHCKKKKIIWTQPLFRIFQKKMLFLPNFFFFFFYSFSRAIYLFHRPMVTKPISVTRSNGRLGRCTKSWCTKNEQNITRIPKTRAKKMPLDLRYFPWKRIFTTTCTKDLVQLKIYFDSNFDFLRSIFDDHFFRISQQIGDVWYSL